MWSQVIQQRSLDIVRLYEYELDSDMEYMWSEEGKTNAHGFLIPIVEKEIADLAMSSSSRRLFDAGCGNGYFSKYISKKGWEVIGIDKSESGIREAKKSGSSCSFFVRSAYEDLSEEFGKFDIVVSLEVIEHLYDPRTFVKQLAKLVDHDGHIIISTPYHGYLKNLVMALAGKLDGHFTALWDNGHIKFWSRRTLRILLEEQGIIIKKFRYAGRIRQLAKSMVLVCQRR